MLGAGTACGIAFGRLPRVQAQTAAEPFKISLAEWSLVQTLKSGAMTNLDFPRVAKEQFKIDCIEFVDQFFADKAKDKAYLAELTQRAKDAGVTMGLIMLDTPGALGVRSENIRAKAVAKTCEWIDAAHELGCYAIRINARGGNDPNELRGAITESCAQLADYAAQANIDVCIENHGGPSSDPEWLVSVMKAVGKPNFGTLPDFGNFPPEIDRYDAVEKMMPYAKAVSAKATSFTPDKRVAETDYFRMMRIVRDAGWTKYVGVESGASDQAGEAAAIEMTRDLLLQIREEQKRCQPIFNGTSLDGWVAIEGGEWAVEEGVLIGRNGQKWSTNPEVTGSWLRTRTHTAISGSNSSTRLARTATAASSSGPPRPRIPRLPVTRCRSTTRPDPSRRKAARRPSTTCSRPPRTGCGPRGNGTRSRSRRKGRMSPSTSTAAA
ncbi:MAG: hypothetical protein QG656_16 [Candidatus Hydrogenedentes bacterium]|nr:hypothetical protein [Candidatus Hydrogenedentota bacterium]